MAVPRMLTHIAFGAGLDESTEDEVLDPSSGFPVLQNVRQDRIGGVSKRLGFAAMTSSRVDGSSRSSGIRMLSRDGKPCVIDAFGNLDQYVPTINKWASTGPIPEVVYSLQSLPSPASDAAVFDSATVNGMIAVAYGKSEDSAAVMVVIDATDGSIISPLTFLGTGAGDRGFHAVGAIKDRYFIAVTTSLGDTEIRAHFFDTQNIADGWTSIGVIANDSAVAYPSICSLSDRIVIGYGIGSGIFRVVVKAIDETGEIDSNTTTLATGTPTFVDVDGSSSDVVWVTWDNGVAIRAMALSPTSLTTVVGTPGIIWGLVDDSMQSLRVCAGDTHNAQLWIMYKRTALDGSHPAQSFAIGITIAAGVVARGNGGTASISGFFAVYPNTIISSRPLFRSGRYYTFVAAGAGDPEESGANDQGTCILVDWTLTHTNLRPVANVEPGLAPRLQIWSKIVTLTGDRVFYARQFIKAGSEQTLTAAYGSALVLLDFASRDRWRGVDHNGVSMLGGGVTGVWDGADFTELGFLHRPRPPYVHIITPGDPGYLNGTYKYVAVFEDVDAAGNVVVSGISDPKSVDLTNQTTTIEPQTPVVTYRTRTLGMAVGSTNPRVRTVVYRTDNTGEPPYYRVGYVPASSNLADDMSDDDLRAQPQLYAPTLPGTAGEKLDRRAPSQLLHLVSYAGMLVGAKGGSIFFSGQPVYGEATWFSPIFEVPVPGASTITALAELDGSLYIFTEESIWSVSGEAPSDNGLGGGIGTPRKVATDVGCIAASSLVVTSLGIFFQSHRGLELYGRGGGSTWIGEKVQRTLEAYPYVTAARLDARNALVRFSLAKGITSGVVDAYFYDPPDSEDPFEHESGGGRDLVFDLTINAWQSVDDKYGSTLHEASQDACIVSVNGAKRYAWLGSNGVIYTEGDASYVDNGVWITMVAETGWFKVAGIQGKQIFNTALTLARKHTSFNLSVSLGYNYGQTYATPRTWTYAEVDALLDAGLPITQLRHDANDEGDGTAVRVRFEDAFSSDDGFTTGSGQGATWLALTLNITPREGPAEVPAEAA